MTAMYGKPKARVGRWLRYCERLIMAEMTPFARSLSTPDKQWFTLKVKKGLVK